MLDPEHGDRDHHAQYEPNHYLRCLLLPLRYLLDPFKRHRLRYRLREIVFFLLYLLLTTIANAQIKEIENA